MAAGSEANEWVSGRGRTGFWNCAYPIDSPCWLPPQHRGRKWAGSVEMVFARVDIGRIRNFQMLGILDPVRRHILGWLVRLETSLGILCRHFRARAS